MPGLEIIRLYKAFDGKAALADVSFRLPAGETLALLGPSGSGKSTLLNIVAGLDEPDRGDVLWEGQSLLGVPAHRRAFGLMFQDYMLFPHMDVGANVAFGLQMGGWQKTSIEERVHAMLELVGLPGFEPRSVVTLSGGEQQRVALARALAPNPRLLLLDEPLGALDRLLRERLALELRRILRQIQQTTIYVTHDQEEAFLLADQVILLDQGQIIQTGTPQELYNQPRTAFAARFLGLDNILEGRLETRNGETHIQTALGSWAAPGELVPGWPEVLVLLRPDAVSVGSDGPCQVEGRVAEVTFRGNLQWLVLTAGEISLSFDFPAQARLPAVGENVCLSFDPATALQVLEP
jgi:spermidine/putrescine transport system ATP-binding protein